MSRRQRVRDAAGVALFEIVVGIFLLGLIFVPIVNLLIASNQATTIAQFRTTAYPLALGELDTYLALVEASSTIPANSGSLSGIGYVTNTATTFPSGTFGTATFPTTTTIGTEPYHIYAVGGWCVLTSTSTVWQSAPASGTVTSVQYFVAVKVSWGGTSTRFTGSAIQSAPATTQSSWGTLPTSTAIRSASGGCPVGLS